MRLGHLQSKQKSSTKFPLIFYQQIIINLVFFSIQKLFHHRTNANITEPPTLCYTEIERKTKKKKRNILLKWTEGNWWKKWWDGTSNIEYNIGIVFDSITLGALGEKMVDFPMGFTHRLVLNIENDCSLCRYCFIFRNYKICSYFWLDFFFFVV